MCNVCSCRMCELNESSNKHRSKQQVSENTQYSQWRSFQRASDGRRCSSVQHQSRSNVISLLKNEMVKPQIVDLCCSCDLQCSLTHFEGCWTLLTNSPDLHFSCAPEYCGLFWGFSVINNLIVFHLISNQSVAGLVPEKKRTEWVWGSVEHRLVLNCDLDFSCSPQFLV